MVAKTFFDLFLQMYFKKFLSIFAKLEMWKREESLKMWKREAMVKYKIYSTKMLIYFQNVLVETNDGTHT